MGVISAGLAIKEARIKAGLSQEELSEGICSLQSLSRIETGTAGVSPATFQALMAHAGAPTEIMPTFANRSDFDCFYALKTSRYYLDNNSFEKAQLGLAKVEKLMWNHDKFYYQEWLLDQCIIMLLSESETPEFILKALLQALHISHPDINLSDFKKELLSKADMELLIYIEKTYSILGDWDTFLLIHNQLSSYIDNAPLNYVDHNILTTEETLSDCDYLLYKGDYQTALKLADEYREKMLNMYNTTLLLRLTFIKGYCMHKLGIEDPDQCMKSAFYSAHALQNTYANYIKNTISRLDDFQMPEFMSKLDEVVIPAYTKVNLYPDVDFSDDVFDIYGSDVITIGRLIYQLRKEQNISQIILCQGLCSKSKLSKIENGSLQPDIALVEALLQRLGISERIFTFWGNDIEAKLYDLKFKLIYSTQLSYDEYMDLLNEMGKIVKPKQVLYYQDYLVAKAELIEDSKEKEQCLLEALHCTLPDFDISNITNYRLSWEELSILGMISKNYIGTSDSHLCTIYFHQLMKYFEAFPDDTLLKHNLIPALEEDYLHVMFNQKNFANIVQTYETTKPFPFDSIYLGMQIYYYAQALGEMKRFDECTTMGIYGCNLQLLNCLNINSELLEESLLEDFDIHLIY